ncbi:GNAT family N-acetyltransferase [Paenibacillus sp. GCM10023252]|uniref:GNAT family N-acetyltransferase n=1 Tax=Paenibacillus sp. GCM10023252 TaxID=3252649 RepID=UPI00361081F7
MSHDTQHNEPEVKEEIIAQKQGNSYELIGIGGKIGEITYQMVDVDTWIIDHTFVDPRYRGRNLARQLLDFVVDEAREKGRKIIPSCSYVLAEFKRNPDRYGDVWLRDSGAEYADPYSSKGVGS